jgi:hypothetical protein
LKKKKPVARAMKIAVGGDGKPLGRRSGPRKSPNHLRGDARKSRDSELDRLAKSPSEKSQFPVLGSPVRYSHKRRARRDE